MFGSKTLRSLNRASSLASVQICRAFAYESLVRTEFCLLAIHHWRQNLEPTEWHFTSMCCFLQRSPGVANASFREDLKRVRTMASSSSSLGSTRIQFPPTPRCVQGSASSSCLVNTIDTARADSLPTSSVVCFPCNRAAHDSDRVAGDNASTR